VLDGKKRDDVQPGTTVKVVEKHNQRTGQMTEGVVKKILTSSAVHPHGIKVLLDSGVVGRVKEVIKNKTH
jgi:uncharacterized repeat protein (TIGR03833 family)